MLNFSSDPLALGRALMRRWCCLVWVSGLGLLAARAEPGEMTRIADIRALTPSALRMSPPVRLHGVVTLVGEANLSWVVQDESAGIWVSRKETESSGIWQGDLATAAEVRVGSVVELDGVADAGGFSPIVRLRSIRVTGHSGLPAARTLPLAALISGGHQFQLVEAEGLVIESRRSGKRQMLRLDSRQGGFAAEVKVSKALFQKLVGSEVRLTGVASSTYNSRSEFVSMLMRAYGDENVRIVKAAPADPFDVPKVPLGELSPFSPDGHPLHRQRVEGTVTFCSPGSYFYLQDGKTAIRVGTASKDVLRPGERLEASGFVDRTRVVAGMVGAVIRRTGTGVELPPVPIDWPSVEQIFKPFVRGAHDSRHDYDGLLVATQGLLVDLQHLPKGVTRLILSTNGHSDSALLPPMESADDRHKLETLRPGSVVGVTGIAEFDYPANRESAKPMGMSLQLRDFNDFKVLQPAPWWTPQRIQWSLASLLMVIAATALWIVILKRMVASQARHLEETLRTHHNAEIEMKGAREERFRLAADLHDGLQQHLTGATYRLEAAIRRLGDVPADVQEQFAAARAAMERTRSGLRENLLGLRHVEEGPAEFPALLRHAAGQMEHWPKDAVEIVTTGEPFPLSRKVMGSLLMFTQEAVSNALRHGAASRVRVGLNYLSDNLELCVEDDGSGFAPAQASDTSSGHFGLESMRYRLRVLGGAMELASQPGQGTRIIARLARKKAGGENAKPASPQESLS